MPVFGIWPKRFLYAPRLCQLGKEQDQHGQDGSEDQHRAQQIPDGAHSVRIPAAQLLLRLLDAFHQTRRHAGQTLQF